MDHAGLFSWVPYTCPQIKLADAPQVGRACPRPPLVVRGVHASLSHTQSTAGTPSTRSGLSGAVRAVHRGAGTRDAKGGFALGIC